jgi:hypothetical protein
MSVAFAADVPESGGVAHRTPVDLRSARASAAGGGRFPWAPVLAGALLLLWLLLYPRTPDLAAQVYRVDLFAHEGFAVWDERWYAGHALPGYSLLFAPLTSLVGLRAVAVLSALASAALFERLALAVYGPRARWGAAWFAVAAVGDVWIGRVTFASGVAFALAAALAFLRGRSRLAGALALACAAASPVAGVLLALAGVTHALARRSMRSAWALAAGPLALVVALALLFGEGGFEPFPASSFFATVAVALAFLWALPPSQRLLRAGAFLYLVACVLCLVVRSPMGSNVARYGVLLAGPLLVCALAADGGPGRSRALSPASANDEPFRLSARAPVAGGLARVAVLAGIALWTVWGPARETLAVAGSEATSAAYYVPVERFLASRPGPVRVEVPLTRSHWEAALLAPRVSLARGWEKQLEERYDAVLLGRGLTAGAYERWLHAQAVSYVALPDAPLDPPSAAEGRLIARGLPFLREVFRSAHWRIFVVLGATPLLEGPGRLASLGHDSFALRARAAGTFLVRVHFTRYFTLLAGDGCVAAAPGGWTKVIARAPGWVTVAARFSLSRALGLGGSCAGAGEPVAGTEPAGSGDYRWLVPVRGAPPSIAAENRAPGTRAWRLPGPASLIGGAARGPVAGYVARQAIAPGETQRVYVDAPGARLLTLQVFRMGWYGGLGGRLVLQSKPLPAVRQPPCSHRFATGLTECRWHPTLSFPIPAGLASGVYVVKLRADDGAERDCLFVVRAPRPSPLLVEIPTATYEAYNAWGGDSLYPGGSRVVGVTGTTQGVEVSYDRPYDSQTGAGQFFVREVALVRFLERYGYPISYTTIDSLDGEPGQVAGARALVDAGHSEYWSARDAQVFAQARDAGTSLVFLSSDTLAWRVRFAPASSSSSEAGAPGHVIVAFKEHASSDPDRAEPTSLFPLGGADLTGSAYNGCITPRVALPGPPTYHYYAWTPAPGLQPEWLFAGSGVTAATRIPGIVGYELDQRTPATPPSTQLLGTGAVASCQPQSEPAPTKGTLAETTLYSARSGALVFATGTLGWLYGLSPVPQAGPDTPRSPDPRVVAITRDLLARVLR